MNIYLGEPVEYNDMQGPCAAGFHVPLITEWQAIYNAGVSLGAWSSSNGVNFATYLKIPMAGGRNTNLSFFDRTTSGYYRSSTPNSANNVCYMYFYSGGVYTSYYLDRSLGAFVRGFKDSPIIPDSSWTVLKQGTGTAGIYHNSDLGLISISSDGTTWYTISDKNVGATASYTYYLDDLTEANCGKVFQRGNNYAFSGDPNYDTSQISTSNTKVDVTGYGPGNYYESSTWITTNPWQSSASDGNNLRGGTSQGSGTKYPEIQNVYIGEYVPDFATRGPCPEGFHVPTVDDWQGLNTIMTGLSITTGNGWRTCFHMPFAGERGYSNSSTSSQNSMGMYWSSSNYVGANDYARRLTLYSSFLYYNDSGYRAAGHPIRAFKNEPVVPDSNWTVIYQSGNAGIYHNTTEGIISASSDGETWITIADKNLGATVVYNDGDTLSESNCGGYYQWGNNYMFPFSGSVTTSSTKVNAGSYGPGNYYSSSTFITGNYNWDSSNNDNLRGGVDGNVPV